LYVSFVALSTDYLHNKPQYVIVEVGILVRCLNRSIQCDTGELADVVFKGRIARVAIEEVIVPGALRNAARVIGLLSGYV
jgi:hypothetical protein